MTVQKIAPVVLISYVIQDGLSQVIVQVSSVLSGVIGPLGGLNQVILRKLMAYSSISHLA